MSEKFVAEIRIFGFQFAPVGWAFCDGQLLPLSQNTALFSLIGTYYGGNGMSNFALPNLQGRMPMHPGQGPGLSLRDLGESSGSESVALLSSEIPSHAHPLSGGSGTPLQSPPGNAPGDSPAKGYHPGPATGSTTVMLQPAGSSAPHNNMQPFLAVNFCIAMTGIFPQRP